jgi:hypothetical protein
MYIIDKEIFLENIIEAILNSDNIYINGFMKLQSINLLFFLADKLDFEGFFENADITQEDYQQYFQNLIQIHYPFKHYEILEAFEKEQSNES